ncbi:MAG: vWA domain-containing protein [Roseibacillus sp.]
MKKQLLTTLAVLTAPALSFAKGQAPLGLQSELSHPLLPSGEKQTSYLKVSVTGGEAPTLEERAPINVAIVLDRSSSMSGEKIARARDAAKIAIARLQSNDTVSVISYDNVVEVLVPATKLTDKKFVYDAIDKITSRGSTALFAGVAKGAEELRKFKNEEAINRVILLSDGQANIGPQSPQELGELGTSLAKEGISVTTIGLGNGYNEDLMNKLALNSDGNHSFVQTPGELAQVFDQELGGMLSVVAQNITLKVELAEGVRPVRSLGRTSNIVGQTVTVTFNQLYAEQDKFLLLEVETPSLEGEQDQLIANTEVSYFDLSKNETAKAATQSVARITNDKALVEKSANRDVMVAVVDFIANEKNLAAVKLRDEGKVQEAKDVLMGNSLYLKENATKWSSEELAKEATRNIDDYAKVDTAAWGEKRKAMTQRQNEKVSGNSGYRSKD